MFHIAYTNIGSTDGKIYCLNETKRAPKPASHHAKTAETSNMARNDTYNIKRHERVMIAVQTPPNIAVSIKGTRQNVGERMNTDQNHAIVEIDIEEVKNDMLRRGNIPTPITINILPNT